MANFEKPTKSICTTCIHNGLCRVQHDVGTAELTECKSYRKKHFRDGKKKVKSVYPVRSERLCGKCIFHLSCCQLDCYRCKLSTGLGQPCICTYIKRGQPCKHFKRTNAEKNEQYDPLVETPTLCRFCIYKKCSDNRFDTDRQRKVCEFCHLSREGGNKCYCSTVSNGVVCDYFRRRETE